MFGANRPPRHNTTRLTAVDVFPAPRPEPALSRPSRGHPSLATPSQYLFVSLTPSITPPHSHRPLTSTPAADLLNVFEVFLPQLLLYPNPADPLNGDAASLLLREPERYKQKIKGQGQTHYSLLKHLSASHQPTIALAAPPSTPPHPNRAIPIRSHLTRAEYVEKYGQAEPMTSATDDDDNDDDDSECSDD